MRKFLTVSVRAAVAAVVFSALTASPVSAAPFVVEGNTFGSLASASGEVTLSGTDTLTFSLLNISEFDARITGVGFDLGPDNIDGFTGDDVGAFAFEDTDVGNVPQFNSAVLDFAFITGPNFAGGSPNDGIAPGDDLEFIVLGDFTGFTEEQLASLIFVRFQRVGREGEDSDVGVNTEEEGGEEEEGGQEEEGGTVPEPASLLLLGAGMAATAARIRQRKANQ